MMAEYSFASQDSLHPDIFRINIETVAASGISAGHAARRLAGCDPVGYRFFPFYPGERCQHVVVPVEHSAAVLFHIIKDFRLGLQNAFPAAQKFQMALADIRHHADIRPGNAAQPVHFSEMVDPHLQHRHFRIFRHGKNGERNADFIVIIPLGLVHPVLPGEHCSDKLLCAGLSHAARDPDHLHRKLRSVKFRNLPERLQAVFNQNTGACRILRQPLADHAKRSFFKHVRDEAVAVRAFSFHRDENAVLFRLSGINHHSGSLPAWQLSRTHQLSFTGRRQIFKRHVFHSQSLLYPQPRNASFRIHSHRSSNPTPMACASCGIREVGVMPGSVLASRQYTLPSFAIMKSMRA